MVLRSCIRGNLSPVVIGEFTSYDLIALLQSVGTFTRATTGTYFTVNNLLATAAIDVVRLDYRNAAYKGLLITGAATNVVLQSQTFKTTWNNAGTSRTNGDDGETELTPDGTITHRLTNVGGGADRIEQGVTTVAGTVYEAFVLAKEANYPEVLIRTDGSSFNQAYFHFDTETVTVHGSSGSIIDTGMEAVGNGWYRCWYTFTENNTGCTFRIYPHGVDGHDIFLGMAQLSSSLGASYIPTTTAAVTRGAELAELATASWYNATDNNGTIVCTFSQADLIADGHVFSINDGTANNSIVVKNTAGALNAVVTAGGVVQASITGAALVRDTDVKLGISFDTNIFILSVNGANVGSDVAVTMPTGLTTIDIGNSSAGTNYLEGRIERLRSYPIKTSAELDTLTA